LCLFGIVGRNCRNRTHQPYSRSSKKLDTLV
jgi:hypothetical protein